MDRISALYCLKIFPKSKIIYLLFLLSFAFGEEMPLYISAKEVSRYLMESLEVAKVRAVYTSKAFFPPNTVQLDPWHRWRYNRVLYGYVEEGEGYRLVFRLYFPSRYLSSEGRDYLPLAKQVLRQALSFYILGKKYLGRTSQWSKDGIVDIWLSEKGEVGGEQIGRELYIYQIGKGREEIELLREIAHEWGHHIIPPIGPYKGPEKWANGYIGERLLLNLFKGNLIPCQQREEIAKFLERRNRLPLEIFEKTGYPSGLLKDEGEEGFWYIVGYVLKISEKEGIGFIQEILQKIKGTVPISPSDFAKLLASK